MEILNCKGKIVQDMESENSFQRSRGGSGPAGRNTTGGMPSSPGLWNGLAYFITAVMPATSNEPEDSLAEVSIGWISECNRLSIMGAGKKQVLNAPAMSLGDYRRKVPNKMKFENKL